MITAEFKGWFLCRLATDPDPFDEPRGVSGYVRAYVGEPDLNRVIHFQPPAFVRSHAHRLGVFVHRVQVDQIPQTSHPLLGAAINLLGEPKFEGRNHAVADDGYEPILPFHLSLKTDTLELRRQIVPLDPADPFRGFFATPNFTGDPSIVPTATGVTSLLPVWTERLKLLEAELEVAEDTTRAALIQRIRYLREEVNAGRNGTLRFYPVTVDYRYPLLSDPELLGDTANLLLDVSQPWLASFWLGGWDSDVLMGFCNGKLEIPTTDSRLTFPRRLPERARLRL